MPNKPVHSSMTTISTSADAFLAIADVFLRSAERLHALNASALREAVEDAATVARNLLSDASATKRQATFAPPVIEKSAAYFRSAYEIFATTQQELAQKLTSQLASVGTSLALPGDWRQPFELFSKGVRQQSRGMTNAAPTAATTASAAFAEALSKARKAA